MPSFKIYGSVAGFYDYGPPGCAVKQYITQYWRQHFVLEEDMLQVITTRQYIQHEQSLLEQNCALHCLGFLQAYAGTRPRVAIAAGPYCKLY